jgi:hypothetical protein
VDLGDGGRRHRRAELAEQRVDGRAEPRLDLGAGGASSNGSQPVLQLGQLVGPFDPDDVGPGGEELAELDVARPQFGERGGKRRLDPLLAPAEAEDGEGGPDSGRGRSANSSRGSSAWWRASTRPARTSRKMCPAEVNMAFAA